LPKPEAQRVMSSVGFLRRGSLRGLRERRVLLSLFFLSFYMQIDGDDDEVSNRLCVIVTEEQDSSKADELVTDTSKLSVGTVRCNHYLTRS